MQPRPLKPEFFNAVLSAWPGAMRARRSAAELREVAAHAAGELSQGRTDTIDGLFDEMRSPEPVLRWSPAEDRFDVPQLRFLRAYWEARSPAGMPPASSRIDPLDLVPALGYLMLMEPVDDAVDFRYRVYGTRIVEHSKVEMTGKRVWDIPAPQVAAYFGATYRAVVDRREPLFAQHRTHHDIQVAQWDRLILPFVDDCGTVDRLLVGNVPRIRPPGAITSGRNGRGALAIA